MKNICIFLGAYSGKDSSLPASLKQVVEFIASQRFNLVYGGSNRGLMKVLADTALQLGVNIRGVITKNLIKRESIHENLAQLDIVNSMGERIEKLVALSDAFIVFPGGLGTVEELMKVWVLKKIGELEIKPIYVLNLNNIYTPLINAIKQLYEAGFMTLDEFNMVTVCHSVNELVEKLAPTSPVENPATFDYA
jgi:uncharacterized protein (TIGR00730 family)